MQSFSHRALMQKHEAPRNQRALAGANSGMEQRNRAAVHAALVAHSMMSGLHVLVVQRPSIQRA